MAYADTDKTTHPLSVHPLSVAAVIGVHLAIGYAFVTGMAFDVIKRVPTIIKAELIRETPPPPKPVEVKKADKARPIQRNVVRQERTVQLPRQNSPIVSTIPVQAINTSPMGGAPFTPIEPGVVPQPKRPDLSRRAIPGRDRLNWITSVDYPASALRESVEGVVAISASIGSDGRVQSCEVTQSSGNALLDSTTCRLYVKRGRFAPAQDSEGNAIPSRRTDRFRWQIPAE